MTGARVKPCGLTERNSSRKIKKGLGFQRIPKTRTLVKVVNFDEIKQLALLKKLFKLIVYFSCKQTIYW